MAQRFSTDGYFGSCRSRGFESRSGQQKDSESLTLGQIEIAQGILFTTGTVVQGSTGAELGFHSDNKSLVEWVESAFGSFSKGVRQTAEGWEWTSQSATEFDQLVEDWTDETGAVSIPERVNPGPEVLRFVYATVGGLRAPNGNPRPVFNPSHTNASPEDFEDLTRHFYPLTLRTLTGNEVYLNQTEDFFQYIGSPIAGREADWINSHPFPGASRGQCHTVSGSQRVSTPTGD